MNDKEFLAKMRRLYELSAPGPWVFVTAAEPTDLKRLIDLAQYAIDSKAEGE